MQPECTGSEAGLLLLPGFERVGQDPHRELSVWCPVQRRNGATLLSQRVTLPPQWTWRAEHWTEELLTSVLLGFGLLGPVTLSFSPSSALWNGNVKSRSISSLYFGSTYLFLILKEINPEYSLKGLMLKLTLQYFGHLMRRSDSLEKTLMLEKIEGKRRRGRQRMRWLSGITNSMEIVKDREPWHAAIHGGHKALDTTQ